MASSSTRRSAAKPGPLARTRLTRAVFVRPTRASLVRQTTASSPSLAYLSTGERVALAQAGRPMASAVDDKADFWKALAGRPSVSALTERPSASPKLRLGDRAFAAWRLRAGARWRGRTPSVPTVACEGALHLQRTQAHLPLPLHPGAAGEMFCSSAGRRNARPSLALAPATARSSHRCRLHHRRRLGSVWSRGPCCMVSPSVQGPAATLPRPCWQASASPASMGRREMSRQM